ncbi:MAG: hypothetical protein U5L96_16670 [Owenweeksia sp.]|nr:hypothetical protein [Owenweeksia sp.]
MGFTPLRFTNDDGCDSAATLYLTIDNFVAVSINEIACDSYLWAANGQTYTTSGVYNTTLIGPNGCDSHIDP